MNIQILIAFSLGMIVLAASPGPGVLGSVAKALSEGLKSAFYFLTGLITGDMLFFLLAFIGMSAISKLMGHLFFIIKLIGGIYLIYLGILNIKNRKENSASNPIPKTNSKSFISGFLVTMGNPKPILFYASVLPTLINMKDVHIQELGAIILLIALISYGVIGSYCCLAVLSKSVIRGSRISEKTNTASGMLMMAAGAWVILKE